mmetsp:Transcript_42955/g.43561  ORF Transcript_42955/g.43561 Transcript_42955/m.43561 type:complete len:80 (+) Transcript_42955:105-344(+)
MYESASSRCIVLFGGEDYKKEERARRKKRKAENIYGDSSTPYRPNSSIRRSISLQPEQQSHSISQSTVNVFIPISHISG